MIEPLKKVMTIYTQNTPILHITHSPGLLMCCFLTSVPASTVAVKQVTTSINTVLSASNIIFTMHITKPDDVLLKRFTVVVQCLLMSPFILAVIHRIWSQLSDLQ